MNYKQKLILPMCAAFLLYGCNSADDSNEADNDAEDMTTVGQGTDTEVDPQVKAEVKDVEGKTLGTVNFTAEENSVVIETALEGLEPGYHGFHVHENAACEPDAKDGPFTTAEGTSTQLMKRILNTQVICPFICKRRWDSKIYGNIG